ncbi:tetratricopeptide repeat protein 39C-like [Sycon ciliatum]
MFETLCKETRWSPGFYGYLAALCMGSDGQIEASHDLMKKLPSIIVRKNSNYEKFVLKKTARFQKVAPTVPIARTLLFEVVYLWNYTLFANIKQREELLALVEGECAAFDPSEQILLAANLLVRSSLNFELDRPSEAETCARQVLQFADVCVKKKEQHIPAYATFIIGQIYQQSGDFVQMKQAMSKAKSAYSDYEVEGRLQTKIKVALESGAT